MNTDQIEGVVANAVDKAERAVGDAIASAATEARGIKDQMAGALQTRYERATESLTSALDDAPAAFRQAAKDARRQVRRGNAKVKRQLGDNGPLYLLAGAISVATLGILALRRR